MTTYLDWNATTPLHPAVITRMQAALADGWANPSSIHQAGRSARRYVEDTRERLASLVKLSPRDLIWTGGGTEANHLALSGASSLFVSRLEHPSISAWAEREEERGVPVSWLAVSVEGVVDLASLEEALEARRRTESLGPRPVIALQAANQETGALQPLEGAAELALRFGAQLHVDAVQLVGRGSLQVLERASTIAVSAHKVRGPKGVGALLGLCGWTPIPLGRGGAQERGLRPGTLDAVALAGFGAALERLEESERSYRDLAQLRDRLEAELVSRGGATLHGATVPRLGHVTNFRVPAWRGDELVAALDLEGICVSSGSACSAGTPEPSPVLQGMVGRAAAIGAVRVSLGEETSAADVSAFLRALETLGVLATSR